MNTTLPYRSPIKQYKYLNYHEMAALHAVGVRAFQYDAGGYWPWSQYNSKDLPDDPGLVGIHVRYRLEVEE